MGGRSAVGVVVAVWFGMLVGSHFGSPGTAASLVVLAPLCALAWRGPARVGTVAVMIALVVAAASRFHSHRDVVERVRDRLRSSDGLFRLEGRVVAPPRRESGEPIVVVEVRSAEPPLLHGARVRLRLPPGSGVEWSDGLSALARIEIPRQLRNPGGFDARAAADASALAGVGRAYWASRSPARGPSAWPRVTFARWRRVVERRLARHLTADTRELLVPLVLGDRTALSPEASATLRASGLIHLLALSGLHVGWMAAIARGLVSVVGGGVGTRAIAGALCALAYVGLAGPLPSLARAAATEVLHSVARLFSRAFDPLQALALSALGLLVVAPGWASDLGFQLSCAATLGLVTIGQVGLDPTRHRWWLRAFVPTASAQITAAPLLLHRFHSFSWVAPLANLVAVPIAGLLLAAAWLAVALDALVPGLGSPWFGACEALGHALRAVAGTAAGAPAALFATGCESAIAASAGVGAGLLAIACAAPRDLEASRRRFAPGRALAAWAGSATLGIAVVLAVSAPPLAPPRHCTWLVVLDVGQGDALALGFGDGWWLVDAGPHPPGFDTGESVVLPFLRWAGVRTLRSLVFTHDDGDHTGGGPAVLRAMGVEKVWVPPGYPDLPGPGRRFAGTEAARGALLRRRPDVRALWPPLASVDPVQVSGARVDSDNNASLVLEIGSGGSRMLLLGDADSTVEAALPVAEGLGVLKVAHHGSDRSSGGAFLERTRPRFAAISCGRANSFGHPAPRVLEELERVGARILRTDQDGALWLEAGPRGVRVLDWRRGTPGRGRSHRVPSPAGPSRHG